MNLTQRFPLPGERSARRDAAGWVLEAARARVLADSAGLFFEVKRAFVETGLAEVRLAMTERVAEVFRQGAQNAVIREAEGDISLYNLQRIRVERVRYENFLAEDGLAFRGRPKKPRPADFSGQGGVRERGNDPGSPPRATRCSAPRSWSLIVSWRARSTGDPNWLPPTRSWKLPGPAADWLVRSVSRT